MAACLPDVRRDVRNSYARARTKVFVPSLSKTQAPRREGEPSAGRGGVQMSAPYLGADMPRCGSCAHSTHVGDTGSELRTRLRLPFTRFSARGNQAEPGKQHLIVSNIAPAVSPRAFILGPATSG